MPVVEYRYFPPLSDVVAIDQLPDILNFLKEGLQPVFDKIFYKDLQISKSSSGDSAFYSLDIVSRRRLSIELPGTEIFLVLNPDYEDSTISSFPITVFWEWKIISRLRNFNLNSFSFGLEDIYHAALAFLGVTEKQALQLALRTFVNPANFAVLQIEQLVADINAHYGTNITVPPASAHEVEELLDSIHQQMGINPYVIIFAVYIATTDIAVLKERVQSFFSSLMGGDIEAFIKDIVIPKARATLALSAAIEFPRKYLKPVYDQNGNNPYGLPPGTPYEIIPPDANGFPKLLLRFAEALFYADTDQGLGYNMNIALTTSSPAQIGNTGLIINIQNLKIDLSRKRNIPEADLEGRPPEFMGVYTEQLDIILPKKWFKEENGQTLKISGERLLIGTGGISGAIALQTVNNTPPQNDDYFWFRLGKNPNKSWRLGFNKFDITFRQNAVTASNIIAALEIPRFKSGNAPLKVNLEGHLYEDGDFSLTGKPVGGVQANLFDFVHFNFLSFEMGRQDDNFYIGTSCEIIFTNPIMQKLLKDQVIKIPGLRIYSDGHIELVTGNAFLPVNLSLHLGPIDIAVTGIYFGSYQQADASGQMRKYNYFGLDGAISLGPLGVDAKGKGIKYYFTVDDGPKDNFIRVESIEIDLVIPGSANPASAIAIIHGAVSIPAPGDSPEYFGEISIKLPKLKIAGGASMKLQPKAPAFIIDAFIDLPAPIPLGPVGIYGFRGLNGYRYVATKEAAGLVSGVNTWYEYYKAPPKGIDIRKFSGPERTKNYPFPFSIGAGAVLGTSFDSGTIISIRAMLLLSIPTLFMVEGRASILSARLGLTDNREPPFFAFIAWGDNSIEMGIGADFQLPQSSGWILDLYAEVQAGFFFNNPSRWYVNFGTKQQPISARVLTILTAQTYLMLSAKGIEAGARVEFDLNKRFGPAKVHIYAYVEVGGRISFERPQIGGYLAFGGMIDIEIWIIGISIGLDALLSVEAAKPFLLYAELRIRVCVRIIVKVCKSFTIELKWEKDSSVDRSAIQPLPSITTGTQQDRSNELVKAVTMLTNEVFPVKYFGSVPDHNAIVDVIPMDSYIDIKTIKGLIPTAVGGKIGGHTTGAENFTDLISPESTSRSGRQLRQVKHTYSIESIGIKAWNGSQWVDYHPYQAIIQNENVTGLKIGYWQRSDNQYDTIRLLATTPFSYTEAGEPGWFIPEQYGINPSTLFCAMQEEEQHCSDVLNKPIGTIYYPPQQYVAHYINGAYYTITGGTTYDPSNAGIAGLNGDYMKVTADANPFGLAKSLAFNNYNSLVILLPDPSVTVKLMFTTNASGADISYYKKIINDATSTPQYQLLQTVHKTAVELAQELDYENLTSPISKIVISPTSPNPRIAEINAEIAALFNTTYENSSGQVNVNQPIDLAAYQALLAELAQLTAQGCTADNREFFSNFYGYNAAWIRRMDFTDIQKMGDYYIVTADNLGIDDAYYATTSTIFKINGRGEIAAQKHISGAITSTCIINNEILISVARRSGMDPSLEMPILLKLDETLAQVNQMELSQPVMIQSFTQLCAVGDGRYVFWLGSTQSDRMVSYNAAFYNATRIVLIDTISFTVSDSLLLNGHIASKAVARTDTSIVIITYQWWISGGAPVLVASVTPNGTIAMQNDHFGFNTVLEDIAPLENGDMVVTGHYYNTNDRFIGLLTLGPILANTRLITYSSSALGAEKLSFASSSNSLQDGWASLMVHNTTNIFTFAIENGAPFLRNYYRIDKPATLQGPDIRIHKMAGNAATKEIYMLSGQPTHYQGEVVTVMDEYLNSCMIVEMTLGFMLLEEGPIAGGNNTIVDSAPVLAYGTPNIVAAANNINIFNVICPPTAQPQATVRCTTSLQQVCWLTMAQYEYNETIPGQGEIAEDHGTMVEALQKTAQPIWRPNTKFYVHFRLKDTVDNGGSAPGLFDYYYGFKTTGPVGHYTPPGTNASHPLASLRQYIDYNRSYPNADGNLLQAKPLFYGHEQCKISVFFAYAFAYHMLQKWYNYNGLPELSGEMHIAIKDPVTDVVVPYPLPVGWTSETVPLPNGSEEWSGDNDPRIPHNIQMLNNMINYINEHEDHIRCTLTIGAPIVPKAYTYSVTLTNLAPRKLYTALLYNAFEANSDDMLKSRQVHEFVFQTSRYADFAEQVNSYILKDDAGNQKQAVFKIPVTVTPANINTAYNIVANIPDAQADALQAQYMHPFDRVTEGLFGFRPNDPAVTTEFNLLKDAATGDTLAILVRNPEPFNIPKIPLEDIQGTIAVPGQGGQPDGDYKALYSKDYAQALIMHTSKKITAPVVSFRFIYKTWNGSAYIAAATIITSPVALNN